MKRQKPPKATRIAVSDALDSVELATICDEAEGYFNQRLAEVWQPTRDQYRSVAGRYCQQHGELEQLRDALKRADAWADIQRGCIEELDARCRDLLWHRRALGITACLLGVALIGLMFAVAWRLW